MLIPKQFTTAVLELVSRASVSDEKVDLPLEVETRLVAAVFRGNSVYREVRSTFSNQDDLNTPCGTVRAWVIGLIWSAGLAGLNQFFAPRNPTLSVSVYIAQLFSYPMGRLCAAFLPTVVFLKDSPFAFTLNPGPFTIKEHMLITIMCNVSTSSVSFVTPIFLQQRLPMFFNLEWAGQWGYQICAILSIQLFGFGLAGIVRRFLVYPPQMIYYWVMSQAALNNALHNANDSHVHSWKISRFNFFFVVMGCMFLYYWLPNTIFPVLTFFNWMTWISPTNATLSILTGSYYFNLGLNPFVNSFDWNWFAGVIDPIYNPFFIVVQIIFSCFVWAVCVIIPVFFSNTWYTAYLPINSWYVYDNTGETYSARSVLGPDGALNQTAYEEYSPPFMSAASILRYGMMFATVPAILMFTCLWYSKMIVKVFRNAYKRTAAHTGFNDIHSRLISRYPEVPEYWYGSVAIGAGALGFAALYGWPTQTPGWIIPLGLFLSAAFVIPIGAVMSVSGYEASLEIYFDVIGGYAAQNKPAAFLLFKLMGNSVLMQTLSFVQDLKLGHYCKIPPKQMFAAQVVSTIVSSFVVLAVVNFQLSIEGLCNPAVNVHWVCGSTQTGFSSSLLWGMIGPERLFTHIDAMYWKIMLAMIAGLVWPIPWYFAKKRWPMSILRYAHPIVMMMGGIMWAPLNLSMMWQSLPFSWFFGVYIKDRWPGWWAKYALVLSTALTGGIALSALVQFFAITNSEVTVPDWWGTTQYTSTCDFRDCRYQTLDPGETFGPAGWH
ncbi:OPT superfamily oligopeptide transporter [Thozetella sp. PMI_491]|nr:OPT superfamily oligopeptide transporter [Thozetella sp. PMI_491]